MAGSSWKAAGDGAPLADNRCVEPVHVRKASSGRELFGMLHEMGHQLLTPDVVSCIAAINACEKSKQWERAIGLLGEMVHQLLTPDVRSSNVTTSACEKGRAVGGSH